MPIAFRYNHQARGDMSLGGDFVVICDFCRKEIDSERPGNVENEIGKEGDVKPVVFLHKECSRPFQALLEKKTGQMAHLLWADLKSVEVRTE